ncbi:MAG: hypothetical protein ABS939_02585 [Psychrobacillus sp.]
MSEKPTYMQFPLSDEERIEIEQHMLFQGVRRKGDWLRETILEVVRSRREPTKLEVYTPLPPVEIVEVVEVEVPLEEREEVVVYEEVKDEEPTYYEEQEDVIIDDEPVQRNNELPRSKASDELDLF